MEEDDKIWLEEEDRTWEEMYERNPDLYWKMQYEELKEQIRRLNVIYDMDLQINHVETWEDLKKGKVIVIGSEKIGKSYSFRTYSQVQIWILGLNFGYHVFYIEKGGIVECI